MSDQKHNKPWWNIDIVTFGIGVCLFGLFQATNVCLGKLVEYINTGGLILTIVVFSLSLIWTYLYYLMDKGKKYERVEPEELANKIDGMISFVENKSEDIAKNFGTMVNFIEKNFPLYKHIIVDSVDHFKLLSKIQNEQTNPIQSIQFLGTMVGFSYIYPIPLAKHITFNPGNTKIHIIGSCYNCHEEVSENNFVFYPISLIIKTMKHFLKEIQSEQSKNFSEHKRKVIDFYIYYFQYDIMEAFVAFGKKKVMAVHALNPTNTGLIFNKQYMGILVDYDLPKISQEKIIRYLQTFKRLREQIEDKQHWSFCYNNDSSYLKVEGKSFWNFEKKAIIFNNIVENDIDPCFEIEGLDSINTFITNSYDNLTQECQLIKNTDERIQKELIDKEKEC